MFFAQKLNGIPGFGYWYPSSLSTGLDGAGGGALVVGFGVVGGAVFGAGRGVVIGGLVGTGFVAGGKYSGVGVVGF